MVLLLLLLYLTEQLMMPIHPECRWIPNDFKKKNVLSFSGRNSATAVKSVEIIKCWQESTEKISLKASDIQKNCKEWWRLSPSLGK